MKKKNLSWVVIMVCVACLGFGCGKKVESEKIVARVNNYSMTVKDFTDEIKYSSYAGSKRKDLEYLLDVAIKKQVLIQEAQRQGLDREKTFMETIERYWEQTLIKELQEKQTRKIYEEVSKDKQREALYDWVDGLYKKADIKINSKVLDELKQE